MWEDGAPFEFLMNHDTGSEFPRGMSPTNPNIGPSLLDNATFMTGLAAANRDFAQDISALYL